MNFNRMAAPLAAVLQDGGRMGGSGFLIKMDGQIYIVTTAHVATGKGNPTENWSLWADAITLHDAGAAPVAEAELFDVDESGAKTPRFKFGRATTDPKCLLDLVLLPLSAENPMATMSEVFDLNPSATSPVGADIIMVGCRPWPAINTERHTLTGASPAGELIYIEPPAQEGDSGGPVVTLAGGLLGMNYGAGNPSAPGQGLVINAALIRLLAGAVDGYIEGWTYNEVATRTRAHSEGDRP